MVLITWLLLVLSLVGLCGMVYPAFSPLIHRTTGRIRLLSKMGKHKVKTTSIFSHLETMLYLTSKKYEQGVSVYRFLMFMLFIFVSTFFTMSFFTSEMVLSLTTGNPFVKDVEAVGNVRLGIGFSLFVSLLCAVIPYVVLRVRYAAKKVKAGYDLLDVIKVMSRHAHLAVDTALSRTADALPAANVLKKPLKLLSFSFASYTYEEELKREADRFVKVIGSTFAISFTSDLIHCYKTGGGMSQSLDKLAESMERQLINVLEAKSEFSDAIHLGTWINLLAILIVCGGAALSIGWNVYAKLQFQTVQGVFFMMLILSSTFASFVISLILSKPRLDYK